MRQIEKSSIFKSGDGGLYDGIQNTAMTAGCSWWCGPAVNLLEDVVLSGYVLWTQGTKCCLKSSWYCRHWCWLFFGWNWFSAALICKIYPHSTGIASFHPFAKASGPQQQSVFLHLKPCLCCCRGPCKSSYLAVPHRALSDQLEASNLYGNWGPSHPIPPFIPLLGLLARGFCSSCLSQPPQQLRE
jgi:hypothetical protein